MSTGKTETKVPATLQLATSRMLKSFTITAYITVIGIGAVLFATVFAKSLPDGRTLQIRTPTFIAFFVAVAIVLAAGVYLWIGMLYFLLKVDRSSPLSKVIWLLALLFFNSWAAAVYFFAVYRKLAPRTYCGGQATFGAPKSSTMNNRENPFKIGDKAIFSPDEHAIGWSWSSFDRLRIHPGDIGVVTQITEGAYLYLDDGRGGFHWECFKKVT
jgi:hypothetical protein